MSVALPCECGTARWVWHCQVSVALPGECGTTRLVWHYQVSVTLPGECGTAMWVWHCHVSVALPCECGTTRWVWHYQVSVAVWCSVLTYVSPTCCPATLDRKACSKDVVVTIQQTRICPQCHADKGVLSDTLLHYRLGDRVETLAATASVKAGQYFNEIHSLAIEIK